MIRKQGVFGHIRNDTEIHVWISEDADPAEVVNFFAHEKGHSTRPYHRDLLKEELKACAYGECAQFAYEMMSCHDERGG